MIKYTFDIGEKDFLQIYNLYKSAGWWDDPSSVEQVSQIISGSLCFITAWQGDTLIGMGRTISDAFDDAYLQDIFVAENYRKQGIATNIIKRLTDYCLSKNIHWIALIATPGSSGIYEKLGFKKMNEHTPMQFYTT